MRKAMEKLAILGGPKAVRENREDIFTWPVVTADMEAAVLAVMREKGQPLSRLAAMVEIFRSLLLDQYQGYQVAKLLQLGHVPVGKAAAAPGIDRQQPDDL